MLQNNINFYHLSADLEILTLSSSSSLLRIIPSCEFQNPAVFYLLKYPIFLEILCHSISFK